MLMFQTADLSLFAFHFLADDWSVQISHDNLPQTLDNTWFPSCVAPA